ncbi:cyclin-domain-containing protein [Lipomyces oligophaga]|uniref:cyclin-domain-containing protein n=1 Tax=Lipomyces oligophaga TaxID=45792 RepID=UPI0034CF4AD4
MTEFSAGPQAHPQYTSHNDPIVVDPSSSSSSTVSATPTSHGNHSVSSITAVPSSGLVYGVGSQHGLGAQGPNLTRQPSSASIHASAQQPVPVPHQAYFPSILQPTHESSTFATASSTPGSSLNPTFTIAPSLPSHGQLQTSAAHSYSTAIDPQPVLAPSMNIALPGPSASDRPLPHLDILNYPVSDLLTMISALLQRIIEANDALYLPHHHRSASSSRSHTNSQDPRSRGLASSVLAFHGRNVPAISLKAYLMRILKYCPATNEVFLSLLVYFDRISKRANTLDFFDPQPQLQQQEMFGSFSARSSVDPVMIPGQLSSLNAAYGVPQQPVEPGSFGSYGSYGSHASFPASPHAQPPIMSPYRPPSPSPPPTASSIGPQTPGDLFVMDSYNIHRLVISGVTVSSKFFSDVFYKNSRYAKVGGLPLEELNHLELQFLLLCDFRLAIPLEELQRYGDLLLQFWEREGAQLHYQQQQFQEQQ